MGNLVELKKKSFVVLEKKGIEKVQANIAVVLDVSGSMYSMFANGTVQEIVDRLLGIGMNMDFNKSIEVFTFSNDATHIGDANESNAKGFVENVVLRKTSVNGGTYYSTAMKEVVDMFGEPITPVAKAKGFFSRLFSKDEPVIAAGKRKPTFVFFITDGDNHDPELAESMVVQSAKQPIFWQFVGIGRDNFSFLKKLDEMEGRYVDNANFFQLNDIMSISDSELYERLLNEFPEWLKEAKQKGILD